MNDFMELFMSAKNGDSSAMEELLHMYYPLLYKESVVNGIFDEDLLQELCLLFLKYVAKFNIHSIERNLPSHSKEIMV